MVKQLFCGIVSVGLCCGAAAQRKEVLTVPGANQYCKIDVRGVSVLPSGRQVTPAGEVIRITHDPFGMALSPDGQKAVTLHNGVFTVIHLPSMQHTRIPGYNKKINSPLAHSPLPNATFGDDASQKIIPSPFSNGSFLGVAFASRSDIVYLSGGDNGAVISYDLVRFKRLDSISLNGTLHGVSYDDSFTSDLALKDDNELLVLDRGNFRLVRIDLTTKKITASIPTGRQPFGLALSPDKKTAFVANAGVYEYPLITGADKSNYDSLLIPWHPYGDNTKESREGTEIAGKKIPGVGSPLSPEAMSVFTIDLAANRVIDKFKTGFQIGQKAEGVEVVGGASPNSIAVGSKFAYVSNASNDNISVINYRSRKIVSHIPIKADVRIDKYRGLLPFGLALSKDEKTLYAALLGFNAVAVIDVVAKRTKGLIPAGWGPSRVLLSQDESELYVISCRGYGAGPNGGKDFTPPVQGTYVGDIQLATFQKIKTPSANELAAYTKKAIDNTFRSVPAANSKNPLPPLPKAGASPIKHIVYITKENRTYDEVFGQLKDGKGDASLARYGVDTDVHENSIDLSGVDVMPNHKRIAEEFAYSDNFYCDSDASIHGHHWLAGVIPNEWVEANSSVNKTAKIFSKAPGRRFPGSTGSIDPEDYAERGGLWEALERHRISFYNFGQANETAHVREEWYDTLTGAAHGVMVPMQKALWARTSHHYAGFNMNIPDQFRMSQFENEFTRKWIVGKEKLPQLLTVMLPNDHGADVRPDDGYPCSQSFMADNDLALGRMLHFLSRTRYWKNMLVIITEDDPQGGVDHIDAHRSLLMMAGPYVKRHYASHTHANFGSILKVIYNILGVNYVNQYDVTASLLQDFFTDKPTYLPYSFVFPDQRIFDPKQAMDKYNKNIDWRKTEQGPEMDNENELREKHYKQK